MFSNFRIGKALSSLFLSSALLVGCSSPSTLKNNDYTQYVNCFVGTDGPGNTYPGVAAPFGMVQLSPDNGVPGWDQIAGYYYQDSTIAGFSHKHLTGTGAGDLYDILVMPYNGRFTDDLWKTQSAYRPYSMFSHDQETASPGYYSVDLLSSGIKAELTSTTRVGMHRYTFPQDEDTRILLDLGYAMNWDGPIDTYLKLEDENTIVGYRHSSGWAPDQREFFVLKSSRPIENIVFFENDKEVNTKEVNAKKTKCEIRFAAKEGEQVLLKVALSSSSMEGAKRNLEAELIGWDFDATVAMNKDAWNKQLSSIEIEAPESKKEIFYTNMYHCFLTPSLHSDVDGAYKGADKEYHTAEGYNKYDTFSLWDTYRTAHPLYTILLPNHVEDFVKSFLSHYDETGLLPVWSLAGNETNMMIGYHSVPVIVDAYFKGIPMDAEKAYEACKQTAMSDAWDLPTYKRLGYVPSGGEGHDNWSVSKTLEYAYDDWCIAQLAKALGKTNDYDYFMKRAGNWRNHYDEATTWLVPRDEKGNAPKHFVAKEYGDAFCESNAWHYFWHLPHDIPALVETVGAERFEAKLDSMFSYYPEEGDNLPLFSTGMIGQYAHGNEPSHHVAYLYNQIGRPEETQRLVKEILDTQYSIEPDGYCGNEDCGQMSAWLVMSSLGIYPVNPADGIYHLTTPWFKQGTINLPNGKSFIVVNKVAEGASCKTITLNGTPVTNYTISHQDLVKGGELSFE